MKRTELMTLRASVSKIMIPQNPIIDTLQAHEISNHQALHDIKQICAGLEYVINTVDKNHTNIVIHEREIQIRMSLAELKRVITKPTIWP
jgi:hypothetical protein